MPWRYQLRLDYDEDGTSLGYPGWVREQADQRMDMALHLDPPGHEAMREESYAWDEGSRVRCNMVVPDDSKALLTDLHAQVETTVDFVESGRVDLHYCRLDSLGECDEPELVESWG